MQPCLGIGRANTDVSILNDHEGFAATGVELSVVVLPFLVPGKVLMGSKVLRIFLNANACLAAPEVEHLAGELAKINAFPDGKATTQGSCVAAIELGLAKAFYFGGSSPAGTIQIVNFVSDNPSVYWPIVTY